MKRKIKIILGTATASVLTLTALAQTASNPGPDASTEAVRQHLIAERVDLLKSTARAGDVIGLPVENLQNVKLGWVKNFALDLESGRIVEVILATGGGQLTAVPPGALQPDAGFKILRLDASPEKIAAAPRFHAGNWAAETESNQVSQVYAYFGEQPYFVNHQAGDGDQTTNADGNITPQGTRIVAQVEERERARQTEDLNNIIVVVNPDGTTSRNYYSNQHAAIGSWSALGNVQSERKLIGMPLQNSLGQQLGRVENLIVDLKAGRIAAVFIRSGRFFWTGGMVEAVPPTELQLNPAQDTLMLDVSPIEFSQSAHYSETEWPNYPLPGYAAGTYTPYAVEPYNNSDAPQPVAQVQ